MNSENLPPHITTKPPGAEKESPTSKETVRRQRSDLSVSILEQLTSPIPEGESLSDKITIKPKTNNMDNSAENASKSETSQEINEYATEIKVIFCIQNHLAYCLINNLTFLQKLLSITNIETLIDLGASETLLDLSLKLPTIRKYTIKYEEIISGKPFSLPSNHSEIQAIRTR